jgi:anti-sigma regulatory factor (Ser/Thr protein kinase)
MEKRVLVARWLGSDTQSIPIYDEASVSTARQRVRETGAAAQLNELLIESVALVASELTHNQLAHARHGYFAVRPIQRNGVNGLEVIAADLGPGIEKRIVSGDAITRTTGSLGEGLGGVFRIADEVEIDSRREEGVCVVARKFEAKISPACEFAIAGVPFPGEAISGDDAVCIHTESGILAAVCDGLGHGPEAREASNKAVEVISRNHHLDLGEIVAAVNAGLAGVRGCVLAIARYDRETRKLQCLSVGDVRAQYYRLRDTHFFTPVPLVIGDRALPVRKLRVEEIDVEPGAVFAMFTDGLESKTNLKGQLDILRLPAIAIAQGMIETHSRGNDDSLVLVARFK